MVFSRLYKLLLKKHAGGVFFVICKNTGYVEAILKPYESTSDMGVDHLFLSWFEIVLQVISLGVSRTKRGRQK